MPRTAITIGPHDHGRRMSLEDFDLAGGQPGRLYELGRGVVTVVEVPNRRHLAQVDAVRQQISVYRGSHPDRIHTLAGGGECKILIPALESERHPDLAVYKSPPTDEEHIWSTWVPDLVVEVVSPGSEHRDYTEKRDEYLAFGVKEYWVVDAERQAMLVLRRSGRRWTERTIRPPEAYRTRLLPGLEFDCTAVFRAAGALGVNAGSREV